MAFSTFTLNPFSQTLSVHSYPSLAHAHLLATLSILEIGRASLDDERLTRAIAGRLFDSGCDVSQQTPLVNWTDGSRIVSECVGFNVPLDT